MGLITRSADLIYTLRFLHILTTPWEEMPAFKKGLIDKNGKNVRKPKDDDEKSVYTYFHRLVFNVKRLLGMVPLGKTRIASYAAALYLLKESGVNEDRIRQTMLTEGGIVQDELMLAEADESWQEFPLESGSLRIPRAQMPQVARTHRGALTQFLAGKGIRHHQVEIAAKALKPTQSEYSRAKVEQMRNNPDVEDRAILISSDCHVVDGHHQWIAKLHDDPDQPIRVLRFNASIRDLLPLVSSFPSAFCAESWFVKDGNLLAGEYELTMPAPSRATGELIAALGSKAVIVEDAKPIGDILGISIYEMIHVNTSQKILVSSSSITR
jgi:hypothetical protein